MDWKVVADPTEMDAVVELLDMSFPVGKAYIQESLVEEHEIKTYRLKEDTSIIATATYGQCFDDGWDGISYIRFLAVHPDHRRKGHAARIIQRILDEMQALGSPGVCISVLKTDVRLAQMWKRRGFVFYDSGTCETYPEDIHDYYAHWF